ncbi:hypothetical protein [Cryobacterium arcticum]|uniref:DUF1648 domain-containing protein n=1 Tax=Cryobacterium arcticum TaxID=670052 RepID=A0A1B1BGZ8_9MICO|nr:hypothetical protein [Cryobacterium arcticum]ANP71828.1 hypothetical protein PA27867_0861 [Cryobacterium arcticum]
MPNLRLSPDLKVLRPALVTVGVACVTMAVASVVFWPDMAESLVTRAANGRHGESVVQRWFAAGAFPIILLLLTALFAVTPELDRKLRRVIGQKSALNSANGVRVMGYLISGVAIAMTVSHFGLVSAFAGTNFPMAESMAASLGLIVILLGNALPLSRSQDLSLPPYLQRLQDAVGPIYRPAARVLVLIGGATIALAFVSAWAALLLATLGTITLILGIYAVGLARMRSQAKA